MNSQELKPCPFCGEEKVQIEDISSEDEQYFMIQCSNEKCSAATCFGDTSENKNKAIEAWNRRTADVEPVKHGKWIQVDNTKCRCSNCDTIALIALYPHGNKNYCPNCGAKMVKED